MDNNINDLNNEYIVNYTKAFSKECQDMRMILVSKELNKYMDSFKYKAESNNYGVYRDENISLIKTMENIVSDKIHNLLSKPVQEWFEKNNVEINREIFKVINSDNPNKINSVQQCFDELRKRKIIIDSKDEEFKKTVDEQLEIVLEPYEFTIENAKLEEIKSNFKNEVCLQYRKMADSVRDELESKKRNFLSIQESNIIKHMNENDKEEKNKAAQTEAINNETMLNETKNIENKQDREMFGLTSEELVNKTQKLFELFDLIISKDDNGKIHITDKEGKEALTDYVSDEYADQLLINFDNEIKYGFVVKSNNKDCLQLNKSGISIRYYVNENVYKLNSELFDYEIDLEHNTIIKKDRNELIQKPMDTSYEEARNDLLSVGIDISKIEGLSKVEVQR